MIAVWSLKGGVGTTTVVAGIAEGRRRAERPTLVVDLDGDLADLLDARPTSEVGLGAWTRADRPVPADAPARLEVEIGGGVAVLAPAVDEPSLPDPSRLDELLAGEERPVFVDVGDVTHRPERLGLVADAARSLLVVRACPLAVARSADPPIDPIGIVVVRDPRRRLPLGAISEACGAPVVAEIDLDPAVGASIDVGFRARPLPRAFARALGELT